MAYKSLIMNTEYMFTLCYSVAKGILHSSKGLCYRVAKGISLGAIELYSITRPI